jgi:rSAM/selenodomain-associated transferase 2/rSAM/selenodomain-associated transferase 1
VIVPALNEEESLPLLLSDLVQLRIPHQVVVVDGGSVDRTPAVAREWGATSLDGPRGRAAQMNTGAGATQAPWLLFLHADSRLPEEARQSLVEWFAGVPPAGRSAHFGFALEGNHWFWRFVEFGQLVRERILGLVYGDQGLLISRPLFEAVDGFPPLPIMEDVEMVRRVRKAGGLVRLPAALPTSPRRYQEEGHWRGWLRNVILISLFRLGVSPRKLARFYPPKPPANSRSLLVFAKAPVPGRVKTRLAAEIGAEAAAAAYRRLGRMVLDHVRGGPYRTTVVFHPPEAAATMKSWLGGEGLEFLPQSEGGLGERLHAAFARAFRESREVVVVGTDAPGVNLQLIVEAFGRLQSCDLVLGPANDGGYYLLGLRRWVPEIFQGIPWSTGEVLEETERRARALGLSHSRLETLTDVDTRDDWIKVAEELSSPPA